MSANASAPILNYPLRHRAPRSGQTGHEVLDAHNALVAMMSYHPAEQPNAEAIAQLIAARLNRADIAAAAATRSVQDDLWHLIHNAIMSADIQGETTASAADRVRQSVGSFFAVERDPPANVVDPEVTALVESLEAYRQSCDAAGKVAEECELGLAIGTLRALNAPHLVLNEYNRRNWNKRAGMLNENCTYLTRWASDPKRAGEHADLLRTAVATIWRLFERVTDAPAKPAAQSDAA